MSPSDRGSALPSLVGLVPCGGNASRLGQLPCSKEVYPIEYRWAGQEDGSGPRPACQSLLEGFRQAGAERAYVILKPGKWDIPSFLGDGSRFGIPLGYLMRGSPDGVPYTLDQAYPFVAEANIVFGFPDILFRPDDAFGRMLERLEASGAAGVLGLFPTDKPQKMDMVETGTDGTVRRIVIKPASTELDYAWILAVWTPEFTDYLHRFVRSHQMNAGAGLGNGPRKELFLGEVFAAAIRGGVDVKGLIFPEGRYLDVGTPEDLSQAGAFSRETERLNKDRSAEIQERRVH